MASKVKKEYEDLMCNIDFQEADEQSLDSDSQISRTKTHSDNARNSVTNILEAGEISFFSRGRLGIDKPIKAEDVARAYLVLRPSVQVGQSLKGLIASDNVSRLLVLPKKRLPAKGERFITFVFKANASEDQIKKDLSPSPNYETKNAGIHHVPAAGQVGNGIYTIASTGNKSHLTYTMTLPRERGHAQRAIGLQDHGTFILATKSPMCQGRSQLQLQLRSEPHFPNEYKEIESLIIKVTDAN